MLDSGHDSIIVPADVAFRFNQKLLGIEVPDWEIAPEVDCDKTAPPLTITVNGVDIKIDPQVLIMKEPDSDICHGAVIGSKDQAVFGVPFFKNVVAVHNLEAKEMEIRKRQY